MQRPLGGMLVVDLTRYLPGAFASLELQRLGARVVRVEQPGGDPMRETAPGWHDLLNAGKESVVCDLKEEPELVQALLERADVVLESFRPGVAARLGVRPRGLRPGEGACSRPEPPGVSDLGAPPREGSGRAVYCSITGFGVGNRHEQRAGHDLNYLGWAGLLEDTAPALPPVQVADLAAGALGAVTEILAALVARERTGQGAQIVVSMTHGAHRLAARSPVLTGGFACYRMYACADGRYLTVGALEPKFFARLCDLLGRPELAEEQYTDDQARLGLELERVFAARPAEDWLAMLDNEDVCVGPVATLAEAAADLGAPPPGHAPQLGEHTETWRRELGL